MSCGVTKEREIIYFPQTLRVYTSTCDILFYLLFKIYTVVAKMIRTVRFI